MNANKRRDVPRPGERTEAAAKKAAGASGGTSEANGVSAPNADADGASAANSAAISAAASVSAAPVTASDAAYPGPSPQGGLARVIAYMNRSYREDIRHRELSRIAGMSPSHFSYAFRKRTGKRPMDYLAEIRIGHAKRHLYPEGLGVKQTAQRVGFADEFYFSRQFKQLVGVPPSAYMRIRRSPMKAIALSYSGQLLAVGMKPLGAPRQHLANRRFETLKEGIADVGDFFRVDLERIAALSPDLIIAAEENPRHDDTLDRLKRIAPVAIVPWNRTDVFGQLRAVAGLLDKEREAEQWVRRHLEQVERAQAAIRPFVGRGETFSIFRVFDGYIGLWSGRVFGHVLYRSLELAAPQPVAELMDGERCFQPLRLREDELGIYAGDSIFVSLADDPASRAYFKRLSGTPGWLGLSAVANGRVYVVSDMKWKFYEPRAISGQLQDAVELLTARMR